MKKIKIFLITSLTSLIFLISSCNFLDVEDYYDELMPYDSVFSNTENLKRYLWSIPTTYYDSSGEGEFWAYTHTPGPLATDEGYTAFNASSGSWKGVGFMIGRVNADNLYGMDYWGRWYKIVRRVNILLSRMDEASDLTPEDRQEIVSYARFIRAYAYYLILMNWGPVVLLGDEVMESDGDVEYYNRYRATMDESIDYICDEFEAASKGMPIQVLEAHFGRPTRGTAYGFIARLRLYQASPLFNGSDIAKRYYGSWKRKSDGAHYISQTYDERRWAVAAAAAKRVIDMGVYELHIVPSDEFTPEFPDNISKEPFPNGIGDIDPFRSYADMFTGETPITKIREYIWGIRSDGVKGRVRNSLPKPLMNGYNSLCTTQKIVDAYRMIDGRDINDASPEYPYEPTKMITSSAKTFSGYTLNNGVSGMYVNREMRFYASIGFNRRFWPGSSSTDNKATNLTITYHLSGNSGKNVVNNQYDYPPTGYILTKYVHNDDNLQGTGAQVMNKGLPIMRYAEILLAYVEAMNNLTKSYEIILPDGATEEKTYVVSRNIEEMKNSFNQVRYRAGLPGLTNEELSDVGKMQELIEREMMVEFLHENRRYYDIRRWGIYEREESMDIMGINIMAEEPECYIPVRVDHTYARQKIVNRKMIFMPISRTEINKALNIDQNPGWE